MFFIGVTGFNVPQNSLNLLTLGPSIHGKIGNSVSAAFQPILYVSTTSTYSSTITTLFKHQLSAGPKERTAFVRCCGDRMMGTNNHLKCCVLYLKLVRCFDFLTLKVITKKCVYTDCIYFALVKSKIPIEHKEELINVEPEEGEKMLSLFGHSSIF